MSGRCPNCASTDIYDAVDGSCGCLDCAFKWLSKVERQHREYIARKRFKRDQAKKVLK